MKDFMIWRRAAPRQPAAQPDGDARVLYLPPIEPVGDLPYELAGLLPNREHNADLKALIDNLPQNRLGDGAVVGLFAADPFLNCKQIARYLTAKGYGQVSNIPPVAGYGAEFLATLDNVHSGRVREQRTLARLKSLGLTVWPAVADLQCLPPALELAPPLLWVTAGFDMWKDDGLDPRALLAHCRQVSAQTDIPLVLVAGQTGITRGEAEEAGARGMLID